MVERPGELDGVIEHYRRFDERGRLDRGGGALEYARTRDILDRHLARPPAVILDVGGAAGRYACPLAREGYEVHLLDPVPKHVDQAREAAAAQPDTPLASCRVGDARALPYPDGTAHAVLLFGPLYHLVDHRQRLAALAEAHRCLRPGGMLFAAAISRFASALDGLVHGFGDDPEFRRIVDRDLESGQHRNPTNRQEYFTDSYFHQPEELREELAEARFEVRGIAAVEGIGGLLQNLDRHWQDRERRSRLLALLARLEEEPSMLGASTHLMGLGRRPDTV